VTGPEVSALTAAYLAAKATVQKGQVREARDILVPAIEAFAASEGQQPNLIEPLVLSADLVHRLEGADPAHVYLERALTIARTSAGSPPLRLAETFCLVAVVEWKNKCRSRAASAYETGIEEGRQAGASDKWLAFQLTGLAELLLDTEPTKKDALLHATRAVELLTSVGELESRQMLFARFALGRGQAALGMNPAAQHTFESLIEIRLRARGDSASGDDKFIAELQTWLAKVKGGQ
jgi:hypothetical protein